MLVCVLGRFLMLGDSTKCIPNLGHCVLVCVLGRFLMLGDSTKCIPNLG